MRENLGPDENRHLENAQLIARARAGDSDAMDQLFARYESSIALWVTMDGCPEDALVRACAGLLTSIKSPRAFEEWLYRIAIRAHSRWKRTLVRSRRRIDSLAVRTAERWEEYLRDSTRSSAHELDPEWVSTAISRLPDGTQQAIQLRFYEGLDCKGVARALRISTAAARKRISDGYARLRKAHSQAFMEG